MAGHPLAFSGLLNDKKIIDYCTKGILIAENFSEGQIRGCTYELRISETAWTYDYREKKTRQSIQDAHIINPFETITIITLEKVNLQLNQFMPIYSKGYFFSLGLTPISTAADPGFCGYLGLTMTNLSNRPIKLLKGEPIAKAYFIELSEPVEKTYSGVHGSAKTFWPYPAQFHLEPKDYDSIKGDHWKFLPMPIQQFAHKQQQLENLLKIIIIILAFLVVTNTGFALLKTYIPNSQVLFLEQPLSNISNITQILGFIIAVIALIRGNSKTRELKG